MVHRDLKPSNVLLALPNEPHFGPDDERFWQLVTPKIADFGLAKLLDRCTRTGALLGTPAYMAPEQTGGAHGEAGPRSDVYALGVILYETVTGRRPFQGSTVVETLDLVRAAAPVPLRRLRNGVPRDLEIICMKCLEKEPRRRYATAAALADDLQRRLAGEPIRARPVPVAERYAKWLRRRPALAVLIVFGAMTVVAAVAGTFWHLHRLRAEVERASKSEAEAMLMLDIGAASLPPTIVVGHTLSAYDVQDVQNNQETITLTVYNQAADPISAANCCRHIDVKWWFNADLGRDGHPSRRGTRDGFASAGVSERIHGSGRSRHA